MNGLAYSGRSNEFLFLKNLKEKQGHAYHEGKNRDFQAVGAKSIYLK